MTTGGLRLDWEKSRDSLQVHIASWLCFTASFRKNWRLEAGGDDVTGVRNLKVYIWQGNIYSRRCGTWNNVTHDLKTQSRTLWECKFMQSLWEANWLSESRVIKISIIFDSEIPFRGLDLKEIAPNTEKDVCYGIIYNSENIAAEMETCHFAIYKGEWSGACSEGTMWQHASLEEHVIAWRHFIIRLEMTVTHKFRYTRLSAISARWWGCGYKETNGIK